MTTIFGLLTGGFIGKALDAAAEGLYEGLFDKPNPADELEAGDIIGIRRALGYEHYAVYIGNHRVIHYAAEDGDFGEASIHEAPISDFYDGQSSLFVLDFDGIGKHPTKRHKGYRSSPLFRGLGAGPLRSVFDELPGNLSDNDIEHIYSPEETVARARSLIGETQYDLIFNNCEHFAVWCKTGVHKSYQVENVLKAVRPLPLMG